MSKIRTEKARIEPNNTTIDAEIQKMVGNQTFSSTIAEDLIYGEFFELKQSEREEENVAVSPVFDEFLIDLKQQLRLDSTKIGEFLYDRIVPHHELTQLVGELLVKHVIEVYN